MSLGLVETMPPPVPLAMNVFGPIDPGKWRNRTWREILEVAVDVGGHLSVGMGIDAAPLFPLRTSTSAIAALLPFPPEFLSMFICIVPSNLQADIPDLPYVGAPIGNSEAGLFSQSTMVAPTETHVLARHFSSRHATSITMSRALPSSADADGPTALTETRTHRCYRR